MTSQIKSLDTCKGSIPHMLFTVTPGTELSSWRHRVLPYLLVVVVFFIIPSLIALITLPTFATPTEDVRVPYLRDWNIIFMFSITLPFILVFLLTERRLLPESLQSVLSNNVLAPKDNLNYKKLQTWEAKFFKINLVSQVVGIVVGIIVSWANYYVITDIVFKGWQKTNGSVNLAGWIFLICQLPLFYTIAVLYVGRAIATVVFLYELAKASNVNPKALHHDNAAGLSQIGKIGLRNQYILAIGGMNLLMFLIVMNVHNSDPNMVYLFIAGLVFYAVAGPFIFIGPLLPFRKSMQFEKQRRLAIISDILSEKYEAVMDSLKVKSFSGDVNKEIRRLEGLHKKISKMPVWPFDVVTIRHFIVAYIFPVIAIIITPLVNYIVVNIVEYLRAMI